MTRPCGRGLVSVAVAVLLLGACASGDRGDTATAPTETTAKRRHAGADGKARATPCPAPQAGKGTEGEMALEDATADKGLVTPLEGMYGHAAAVGDVNKDGWPDLFVGTFADKDPSKYKVRGADGPAPDRLLLGGADGFRIASGFPEAKGRSSGAVFADLDGDDDLDLVVSRNGKPKDGPGLPTTVYRNEGGTFTAAGDLPPSSGARAIGVLDYDGDGRLDLFITADRFSGESSVLLHNKGGLAFEDRTDAAKLPPVDGLGVATADLDGDDRPDLFVTDSNRLFLGQDEGTFAEAETKTFEWHRYGNEDDAAGVAVGDLNRDGRPDLVIGQHYNSTVARGCTVPARVYLNRTTAPGRVSFEDVTEAAQVPLFPTKAPHVEIADLDNDGWPDIVTSASAADGTRPAVLRNLGLRDGVPRFATPPGLGNSQYWVTGGTLDVDHDGRLDVFLVDFEPGKPSKLFRNPTAGGHWLDVSVPADVNGVGTVVSAFEPGTKKRVATGWITLSAGYAGGAAATTHLGLGDATHVDLVVRTPDGKEHKLADAPTNRRVSYPDGFGG